MARFLTAANSVITLAIIGLYDVPQLLQGYSADDVFDTESVQPAEVSMGVDGVMSAGWIPYTTKFGVTLQADSLSNDMFENWVAAQNSAREIFYANGHVQLPATQRQYNMVKGVLQQIAQTPSAKKILQPRKYVIEFQNIQPAPL